MDGFPPHETGSVVSSDVTLFYRRFGRPGRTPLLILHGLSYFSYDWIGPAAALSEDREVVALDLRGFGQSDWSPDRDYRLETFADDVVAVIDALGWPTSVLMGHSFGGRIALATASWHADRVAGLVCVDFAPDVAAKGRRGVAERIGRQPDRFASVSEALAYHGKDPDTDPRSAVYRRYEAFLKPEDGGFVLRRDLHFRDNFRKVLETGKSPPVGVDLWAMLGGLTVPVLMLRGCDSDMFAAETLDKCRAAGDHVTALEIAGGHDIAGDNADGLAVAVRLFLRKLP